MTETEFEMTIRKHKGTIYTVCYMFSSDKDEVADLFQEILINLWKGADSFRGDAAISSWIWKVSLNTCISYERKQKRRLRTEQLDMDIDLFDETNTQSRQAAMLRERIAKLGPFDRAIVLLWLENLSYEEIGQIVGISTKNVSIRLVRIREQLKKMDNNDTLLEMKEQMQELRRIIDNQTIINKKMFRKAYQTSLSSLKRQSSMAYIFAAIAIILSPSLYYSGLSIWFVILTDLMMVICVIATVLCNRHLPDMNSDMVTAAKGLTEFKMFYVNWLKYGIIMILFWIGFGVTEIIMSDSTKGMELPFICGMGVGVIIGGAIGLKIRRKIILSTEELIEQIESIRSESEATPGM